MSADPKERFSSRVADYVKYRPSYPDGVVDVIRSAAGLDASWVVADVGAGTGISSAVFVRAGCRVYGVEPNAEMRRAAEAMLGGEARFTAVAGSAEATGLPVGSVDLVVAAQAFHWFDRDACRREFARILRGDGWVALIWNRRKTGGEASAFLRAYEALLLEHGTDYTKVRQENVRAEDVAAWFGDGGHQTFELPNEQVFGYEGLEGRVRSSSYTPAPGSPAYDEMIAGLRHVFDEHQVGGRVRFEYVTEVYVGRVGGR